MTTPKYHLVRPIFVGRVDEAPWGKKAQKVYRIKALRDIPQHGVKAGTLGGLVTSTMNLSHFGDSWIDYNAKVLGHVFIVDDAYIGGNAKVTCDTEQESIVIRGNAFVDGNATITLEENADGSPITDTIIVGDVNITDFATVRNVGTIRGEVSVYDNVFLDGVSSITGEVGFDGSVRVNKGVVIEGRSFFMGHAVLSENCKVINSTITGSTFVFSGDVVKNFNEQISGPFAKRHVSIQNPTDSPDDEGWNEVVGEWEEESDEFIDKYGNIHYEKGFQRSTTAVEGKKVSMSSVDTEKQALINDSILLLAELNKKNHEYESDIVKIIKYPVMADKGYDTTAELHVTLGRANRMSLNPSHTGFVDAVTTAEKAFIAAESYALKMASTVFTEAEQKKVSKVTDLLSIAANEASSENEKEQAFRQAFKHLEGVIAVPEVAVDTFRLKIGLKELGM